MTDIEVLGEIRCRYNLFDAKEQRYYEALSNAIQALSSAVEVVRCVECKYRYVDGDNVRFNLCLLNHNKVQSDDWYCADGKRREEDK